MRLFRSARWLVLALLLSAIPASSFAGVFISVNFAPPVLPVYEQPLCPGPGLMWVPGYWAYGEDGYYWVPGAWVPAPYVGALWTPGYWGWSGGLFIFHPGYWGRHVGYYGGVNYGFGYGGVGFAGGVWRNGVFAYNTAVMHVDGRYIHSTYEDRGAVERGFVDRNSRVAFSGGPGGIRHEPLAEERLAEHEQHMGPSSVQAQHEMAARGDRTAYVKNNGGNPAHPYAERPLGSALHSAPGTSSAPRQAQPMQQHGSVPQMQQPREAQPRMTQPGRPAAMPAPQSHPAAQPHQGGGGHAERAPSAPKSAPAPKAEKRK
jgi:hypothetical protein